MMHVIRCSESGLLSDVVVGAADSPGTDEVEHPASPRSCALAHCIEPSSAAFGFAAFVGLAIRTRLVDPCWCEIQRFGDCGRNRWQKKKLNSARLICNISCGVFCDSLNPAAPSYPYG